MPSAIYCEFFLILIVASFSGLGKAYVDIRASIDNDEYHLIIPNSFLSEGNRNQDSILANHLVDGRLSFSKRKQPATETPYRVYDRKRPLKQFSSASASENEPSLANERENVVTTTQMTPPAALKPQNHDATGFNSKSINDKVANEQGQNSASAEIEYLVQPVESAVVQAMRYLYEGPIVQSTTPPTTTTTTVSNVAHPVIILSCEGVKYQVPLLVYACCGKELYRLDSQRCVFGDYWQDQLKLVPVGTTTAPPPSENKKIIDNAATVPMKLLFCQDKQYPISIYDFDFYGCCHDRPYMWAADSCLQDGTLLSEQLAAVQRIDNNMLRRARLFKQKFPNQPNRETVMQVFCGSNSAWIETRFRRHYACCNLEVIDTRKERCITDYYEQDYTYDYADEDFCPSGFICCPNFAPVELEPLNLKCCYDEGPYDPVTTTCSSVDRKLHKKRRRRPSPTSNHHHHQHHRHYQYEAAIFAE